MIAASYSHQSAFASAAAATAGSQGHGRPSSSPAGVTSWRTAPATPARRNSRGSIGAGSTAAAPAPAQAGKPPRQQPAAAPAHKPAAPRQLAKGPLGVGPAGKPAHSTSRHSPTKGRVQKPVSPKKAVVQRRLEATLLIRAKKARAVVTALGGKFSDPQTHGWGLDQAAS